MFSRLLRAVVKSAIALAALVLVAPHAEAKPEYAKKEGVNCLYCHVVPGGDRNFRGVYYGGHKRSFAEFDNDYESKVAGVDPKSNGAAAKAKNTYPNPALKVPAALKFTLKDIDGKPVNLARYEGKVVLLVNVASKCGYTPQYTGLQKLYEKYKEKGFVIVGVPSNDFGMQEPGDEKEIKAFCTDKYSVTFPLLSKVMVKGEEKTPLYAFLTGKETNPKFCGDIEWNFTKFLINRKGEVVGRFKSNVAPEKPEFTGAIEKELKAETTE